MPIPFSEPPHIAYKYLLDKGENLTASEIVYLHNKEVSIKKITNATGLRREAIRLILNHADKYIENHKKVVMEMGKFKLTQEEYNGHKELGRSDDEIAEIAEVSPGTLGYHKKKWSKQEEQPKVVSAKPSEDYEKTLKKLKAELGKRDEFIGCLEVRISELEETVNNLHSAAEDIEKEAAASREYVEREQELMTDSSVWQQQALQYKAENERLNNDNRELREENSRFKGESALFRATLKAVL